MRFVRRCAALVLAVVLLAGCSNTPAPTPSPTAPTTPPTPTVSASETPTPSPSPSKTADQKAAEEKVELAYASWWDAIANDGDPNEMQRHMRNKGHKEDGYMSSYLRFYNQIKSNRWSVEGTFEVTVLSSRLAKTDKGKKKMMLVDVCFDDTKWDLVNREGEVVASPTVEGVEPWSVEVEKWPDGWFVVGQREGKHSCEP